MLKNTVNPLYPFCLQCQTYKLQNSFFFFSKYALQRTTQKAYLLKIHNSQNVERKSQLLHCACVCALTLGGCQSHNSPAGGSVTCYIMLESQTFTPFLSVFSDVLHYCLRFRRVVEKKEEVEITTDYRYSSSFTYRISCAELGT